MFSKAGLGILLDDTLRRIYGSARGAHGAKESCFVPQLIIKPVSSRDYLTSGEDEHEVFELNGIKMGLLICEFRACLKSLSSSTMSHLG